MLFPTFFALLAVPLVLASPVARASSGCSEARPAALAKEKEEIYASGLVTDFLHHFNPTVTANITYSIATGGTKTVDYGNKFNTTQTLLQPPVYITRENQIYNYSVWFINFDNPNPHLPTSAKLPFLHWQESGVAPCSDAAGNQIQAFISSVPESVAENRYTYLIFREPPNYTPSPVTTADRIILNVTQEAASQGLTLVGANYFLEGQKNNVKRCFTGHIGC